VRLRARIRTRSSKASPRGAASTLVYEMVIVVETENQSSESGNRRVSHKL
jgi:hypothetical protein